MCPYIERSDTVNSKLGAHREQIEQLSGVRNLIKKLQAVFDLPKRLRVCLDQNAVALAVKYYAAAAPLLDKYGEEGAFIGVKEEADACLAEITAKLKAGMASAAAAAKKQQASRAAATAAAAAAAAGEEPPPAAAGAAGAGAEEAEAGTANGSTGVDLGLDMGECVELLEKLGTPQGELQNDYLAGGLLRTST